MKYSKEKIVHCCDWLFTDIPFLNFLGEHAPHRKSSTVGMIDMGGGSVQIAFEVTEVSYCIISFLNKYWFMELFQDISYCLANFITSNMQITKRNWLCVHWCLYVCLMYPSVYKKSIEHAELIKATFFSLSHSLGASFRNFFN